MLIDATPTAPSLAMDELTVLTKCLRHLDIRGKDVLEIGGRIPADAAEMAEVASWCSIDPRNPLRAIERRTRTIRSTLMDLTLRNESYDLVFSSNAFQHISPMRETIFRLFLLVRPGGFLYTHFGPVWSAPDGSHVEGVSINGRVLNFWTHSILPAWSHLVFNETELYEILSVDTPDSIARAISNYVWHSQWINRVTFRDFMQAVFDSSWEVVFAVGCNDFGYDFSPPVINHPLCDRLEPETLFPLLKMNTGMGPEELRHRDVEVLLYRPAT